MTKVDLLAPPNDAAVERAIGLYAHRVRDAYGSKLKGVYLFGSRARGDHRPESDADLAIVLADHDEGSWPHTKRLAGLAYDLLLETGAEVQAWPVKESAWADPDTQDDAMLLKAMRRDARTILVP